LEPQVRASGVNRTAGRSARSLLTRLLLISAVVLVLIQSSMVGTLPPSGAKLSTLATTLSIHVVRTGSADASVLGVTDGVNEQIDVLVNGQVAVSGIVTWIGQYWFLGVPVADNAMVQTRIGSTLSPIVTVPVYVPQPIGPAGFVYASGADLMRNGTPIQLFGVDDQYPFIYAMIASGLWGPADPGAWGKNGLFPDSGGQIGGVTDADSLWREYFRYFLHYNEVAGTPTNPKVNLLRIWVADHSWNPEGTYNAWKSDPTTFWNIFDRMIYWANRSGVYLVPVLGHFATNKDNRFFDTSDIRYAHQVEVVRAIMDRYDNESQIAMWDVWNEPDVDNDVYWASVGGIDGFKAWASTYIADVKPNSTHHLITMGMGGWNLFPGVPAFGWTYHFFFNDLPGLDVSHHHTYGTAEDQYLIDWEHDWQRALGRPHYEGEVGYNAWPGPSPLGYGYWPWYTEHARAAGMPAMSTMVFVDNGKGAYADSPYLGALPDYPPEGTPPPPPPPPPPNDTTPPAVVKDLRVTSVSPSSVTLRWTAPGDDGMSGTATWYDFRYSTAGAITPSNFWAATHYELLFFPHAPGTTEEATTPGLQQGTTYWFALETSDEVPNWSTSSNSPSAVPGAAANLPPVASSVFSPSAPQALQTVTFNASSSYDPDGTIASYVWNFGDGGSGNGRIAAHAYGVAGWYTATLTVTDNGGLTAVQADSVPVTTQATDTTPPATITDVVVSSVSRTSVVLRWTAPGDDGSVGTATWYDFRYSTSGPITEANFPLAVHVDIPSPKAAGSQEQLTLSGLQRGTKYWFGLKASDEVPNWAGVSDSPIARTLASVSGRGRGPGACLVCLWENTADVVAAIGAVGIDMSFLAVVGAVGGLLLAVALLRRHSAREPETRSDLEPESDAEDELAAPNDVRDEMIDDMIDEIMEPPLPRGGR